MYEKHISHGAVFKCLSCLFVYSALCDTIMYYNITRTCMCMSRLQNYTCIFDSNIMYPCTSTAAYSDCSNVLF